MRSPGRPPYRLLASLLATGVLALAGCGADTGEDVGTEPGTTAGTPSPAASSPTPATPEESATTSQAPAGASVAAPAYFVGQTGMAGRQGAGRALFREFRQVPAGDAVDQVLALISSGDALDPDYTTLLPGGTLRMTSYDENALIELPDASWTSLPAQMSIEQARLAVQQIVHTVDGALQKKIPVVFTLEGDSADIFGIATPVRTQGFVAAKDLDVLGLVNVTEPAQGQTVSGTLSASGVASSFEGSVGWQILDGSGAVVLRGVSQADGWIDRLYPWRAEIDISALAPGDYTFEAMTDDPTAGTEGPGSTVDTKAITVQ